MSTPSMKRLLKELQDIQKNGEDSGINAYAEEDNLYEWTAMIDGPEDTVWEGGIFMLKLSFPKDYPVHPPEIKFTSSIYHPNVYDSGKICLDILKSEWSSVLDTSSILISIRSLLCDPNPASPANKDAASMYRDNPEEYDRMVKKMVEKSLE